MVRTTTSLLSILMVTLSPVSSQAQGDWKKVWSDEFNYNGVPDSRKWDYEEGFIRNEEQQLYTRRPENARVENGMLIIEAHKEHLPNPSYVKDSLSWKTNRPFAEYSSASLITRNKAEWKYGRIEARAQLGGGKGMWPAFWTMGVNRSHVGWPRCGEIDIMEYLGRDPHGIYATAIYEQDNGKIVKDRRRYSVKNVDTDFHIYAIEWSPNRIDFFFDQVKYHSVKIANAQYGNSNPFRLPHYLIINMALGGNWGRTIDDEVLPQQYKIDYIRVYQK